MSLDSIIQDRMCILVVWIFGFRYEWTRRWYTCMCKYNVCVYIYIFFIKFNSLAHSSSDAKNIYSDASANLVAKVKC